MPAMKVPTIAAPTFDDLDEPLIVKKRKRCTISKRHQAFRLRFTFWLDMTKTEQEKLADLIDHLKERRLFASTVRDGIRLVNSLRAGELDVLLELFPWIEEAFYKRFAQQRPAPETNVQAQLARLEKLLLEDRPGPRAMSVPQPAGPAVDDDGDLLVLKEAKSDGQSAQNFLDSAFSLIQ